MAGRITNNSRVKKNALDVEDVDWEEEFARKSKTPTRSTGRFEGGELTTSSRPRRVVEGGKGIEKKGKVPRTIGDESQSGRPGGSYKNPTPTKKAERPGGTYKNQPAWYYGANNVKSITVKAAPKQEKKEEKRQPNYGGTAGVKIKTKKGN